MQYWWVNQNQTYQFEVHGGYMWSPKRRTDGGYNQFYELLSKPVEIPFQADGRLVRGSRHLVGLATL